MNNERLCDHTLFMRSILVEHSIYCLMFWFSAESDLAHRPKGKTSQLTRPNVPARAFLGRNRLGPIVRYLQRAVISYNEYDQVSELTCTVFSLELCPVLGESFRGQTHQIVRSHAGVGSFATHSFQGSWQLYNASADGATSHQNHIPLADVEKVDTFFCTSTSSRVLAEHDFHIKAKQKPEVNKGPAQTPTWAQP